MKEDNFSQLEEKGLNNRIAEMRTDLIKIRSELASKSASQKVGQIHNLKKSIARALTVLNKKRRENLAKGLKSKTKEVTE